MGGLLLALVFAAPAVEAHACVDATCATIVAASTSATTTAEPPCADCGLPCANGCCHAQHVATAPDVSVILSVAIFAAPLSWSHSTAPPLADAAGPRRPPRA